MRRVYSVLMVFCLMFSLLGNTALASEPTAAVELKLAEEGDVNTVSGNSADTWDNTVSSGDALPEQPPVTEEEIADVVTGAEDMALEKGAESGTPPEVTRIQWLHELTELFEMSVTTDNYPDNYYSDMNAESEYYYDVMLATEFGLIDTPAGEAFNPQEAATREFAARTLNLCLGYVLEEKTYTYTEASKVTYPDDIQIAVNRGWFQLKNGAFLPQQPITISEKELMLQDARTVRESQAVDQNYNGSYQFVSDVIVVPEGTRVELTDENQLTIYDCPVTLKVGDKFAVISDGFPVVHRVAQIATSGNRTVITFSSVDTKDAFVSLDVQGNQNADLSQLQAVGDVVEFSYIVGGTEENNWEDGEKLETLELVGEREISAVEIIQEYDIPDNVRKEFDIASGVKLKLVCKIGDVDYDYKADASGVYIGLNTKVSFQCNLSSNVLSKIEKSIPVAKIPVGCVGFLTCNVDLSLGGQITLSMSEKISMGVKYSVDDGFRIVKDFQKESFTIQAEVTGTVGASLAFEVNYVVIKGSIYAKTGAKISAKVTMYTDKKSPTSCTEIGAWLYANVGCKVKVDLFVINVEWKKDIVVLNEKNSPVRVYFHLDDGKPVTKCGRDSTGSGGSSGGNSGGSTATGSKYLTPINSQYGYCGINSGTTASGEPFTLFDYSVDKAGNATITKYNGNVSALSIPETLDGHTVVGIGSSVFSKDTRLRLVVIPDSVTTIGSNAFSECSNLASVTLSQSLTSIGRGAFQNCGKLTSIEIPKSLQKADMTDGIVNGPFYNCDGLKEVLFEKGTTEIARGLFAGCTGIESMIIPDTVTIIESSAFYRCSNLKNIVIPNSVTTIESSAFKECTNLQTVVIPDSVTAIGSYAFSECSNLASVTLSQNLTSIGRGAFQNCGKLTSIEIPKSLQKADMTDGIVNGPFYNCDGLKEVLFEKGTTEIARGLFAGCTGIESMIIPDTVTIIESSAFYRCSNLKNIVIPNSVTTIESSAFTECSNLNKVTMSNSVMEIGTNAFCNCVNLQEIIIPDSTAKIGNSVFDGCTNLKKAVLSSKLTSIPQSTFRGCASLMEIQIPNAVKSIENYAFQNCTALARVTMGDKIVSIGNYAFNNCDALTTISLPDSVTSLGTHVFEECERLSDVKLSTGITKIPSYAFNLCPSLQKFTLPYRVTEIDSNAFTNCTGLTEIVIPRSVTRIANNVFSYPAKMTIYGISGTYAQEYAEKIGAKFVNQETPAEKVTLSETKLVLNKGEKTNLFLTVTPVGFTDTVSWKSTDPAVATIDANGNLTAKAVGTATIKVTVGNQSASCQVTVTQPVTGISLSPSSITLEAGESKTLTAKVTPSSANNKNIIWSSSDEKVATVDQSGKVTALRKGTAQITATAKDGSNISGSCTVTVISNLTVCQNVSQLESPHNYETGSCDAWTYTRQGASSIVVTFDAKTNVEENFDFLYLYDKQGKEVGKYTGTQLAGKSVTINGDTVKIKLVSDNAGTAWGFKVTSVEAGQLQAAAPTITRSGNKLIIRSAMDGCTIYYTTNGATPTAANGIKADGSSVTLDTFSGTLQAIAVKSGYADSAVASMNLINSDKNRNVAFTVKGVIGGREVTFGCSIPGAKVYYSTSSSTITAGDKCVNAGETVLFENFYGTVYARSYSNGEWGNVCRLVLKIPVVNTPSISTDSKGNVTIRTSTPSSIIYYTTDGSTPTPSNGTRVSASSVTLPSFSGTLKAIAVRSCFTNSAVASKNLINSEKSRNVAFTVKGVFGGRDVTFGCAVPGAKVYYSTTTSKITTRDKCVNAGETVLFENFYGTVYARSYCNGEWGNVCRLILKIPVVSTPTITIDSRGYATIQTATPGCYLYYTTDGSTPSMTNGRRVTASRTRVYVGRGVTVKAIAVRSCFTNSQVAEKK